MEYQDEEEAPLYEAPEHPVESIKTAPVSGQYSRSFSNDEIQNLKKLALSSLMDKSSSSTAPTLYSTAPSWYKGGPPPKAGTQWASNLIGSLAGAAAAPAQVALQDKNRPLEMKMEDAKQAAIVQGMGGLLQGLLNRKQNDYNNDLNAAAKQASMQHLVSGKNAANTRFSGANQLLDFAAREAAQEDLAKKRASDIQFQQALHDPNSPEAKAMQASLAGLAGSRTPEGTFEGLSPYAIQQVRPIANTTIGAGSKEAVEEAKALNARGINAQQAGLRSQIQAQQKRNEDIQNTEENYLGEDAFWVKGVAPHGSTPEKVREQINAREQGLNKIAQMRSIQDELNAMQHGFTGTFDEWMGQFATTPEGQRAAELVAQAKQIRNDLKAGVRVRYNMGVPQKWEDQLAGSLIPEAGSIQGWLKGKQSWDALEGQLDKDTHTFLKAHGVGLKSKNDKPVEHRAYEEMQVPNAPVFSVRGGEVGVSGGATPDLNSDEDLPPAGATGETYGGGEKLPVAPMPPKPKVAPLPAVAPSVQQGGGTQTYNVTFKGKTFPVQMTSEQAKVRAQKAAAIDPAAKVELAQ